MDIKTNMTSAEWLIEELKKSLRKEIEKQQQDEFAIGFAEWLIKRETKYFESLKELLEIYKKTL